MAGQSGAEDLEIDVLAVMEWAGEVEVLLLEQGPRILRRFGEPLVRRAG